MKINKQYEKNESGVALIAVTCFTAIAAILAIGLMSESSSQLKVAKINMNREQAFYVAEGGAERAVAYLRNGGAVPTNLTGSIGNGTYSVYLLATPDTTGSGGTHAVSGLININPNNSPQNEFLLMTADGQSYDRDALQNGSLQDYSGNATMVRVKSKGNANQTITVDGAAYVLDRNTAYNFVGDAFPIALTNDSRGTNGAAMGQWWISINGSGISLGDDPEQGSGAINFYSIYSIGTVEGSKRMIFLDGIHQESWAKYALWYNSGPGAIWIKSGETFDGPVHANTYIYLQGDPVFNAAVSSTRGTWGTGSDTSSVSFNQGYQLNADTQSMASVNFNSMLAKASVVVTGLTSITFSGTNMVIANARSGWTANAMAIPPNGLVYVRDAASGSSKYDVYLGGTLDGRLSIVTERDIYITNHLTYAVHPTNNSDDALGLIAQRDVIVAANAPDDLDVFAHIMATGASTAADDDGSFMVENYNSRDPSGLLNVYGGIVQYYRGAVGTFNSTTLQTASGYAKNYTFDARFETMPPPEYPTMTNEYTWTGWREK